MAAQVAESLKKCAAKINTGRTKERIELCREVLLPCIKSQDFPEACTKAVIKVIFLTKDVYRDNKSRKAIEDVLEVLAEKYGLASVKAFCTVFSASGSAIQKYNLSVKTSGSTLVLLKWSCILARKVFAKTELCQDEAWKKLVEVQCLASYGVFAAGNNIVRKAALTKLHRIWNEVPGIADKYAEAITKLEPSPYNLCLAGLLFTYCSKNKAEQGTITTYKKPLFDVYLKTVLMSKAKQPTAVLVQSSSLLCHASHDDFKDVLLPGLQKALLRNPEVVLECAVHLVSSVSIDLSKYAMSISKSVAGQLRAKEEIHRQQANQVLKNLAHQCSDPGELEEILKYLFAVLYGSEGKLSVWSDRVSLLEGIQSLENCSVSGESSLEKLASVVADKITPFLQQEVHAGALVHGLGVLAQWCKHFSSQVPKALIESFKKGMSNKNSTAAVRAAYLQCMASALKGNTLLQGMDILPILLQAVERANGQAHQTLVVKEGLVASSILIRLSLATIEAESKLGTFWTILFDTKKQVFVSEKFLTAAPEDAFQVLLSVIEKLFISHSQRLNNNNTQPWYRALVFLLTSTHWKIRQNACSCVQKLFSHGGLSASDLQTALLAEFSSVLAQQQVTSVSSSEALVNGDSEGEGVKAISPKVLSSTLLTLVVSPAKGNQDMTDEEKESIAMRVLADAHHPFLASHKKDLWVQICFSLSLDVSSVLEKNADDVQDMIISSKSDKETCKNILATVCLGSPSVLLPSLVSRLTQGLDDPKYQQVTMDECNIMNTPEGQLHDSSKLKRVKASENAKMQNMSRESKAYSFEEQKMEQELREEIKKKKKLAGKLSMRDEMSEKEKEVYDNQMKVEAETRTRMLELKKELVQMTSLLLACMESNPSAMSVFIPTTLPALLSLLKSPLAAPVVMPLILAFRKCLFDSERWDLGALIGYVTLRLLKPQSPVDPNWCMEPLQAAIARAIATLHSLTTPASPDSEEEDGIPLTATGFAYCFPLLKGVLACGGKAVGGDEDLRQTALEVVSRHCQLRSEEDGEDVDEKGPELLPREDMFTLFAELISTSSDTIKGSRLQQLASLSLVELSKAVSGEQGCTVAEDGELDVLMRCLESSAATLRFSALQGLLRMAMVLPDMDDGTAHTAKLIRRVWVARFDVDDENRALGQRLWDEVDYTAPDSLSSGLLGDIVHDVDVVREAASLALAAAVTEKPDVAASIVHQLTDLYQDKLKIPPPVLDNLGRVVSDPFCDPWPARAGIAQALGKLSPCLEEDQVASLFNFYVPTGLGDRHADVRKHMLASALKAVNDHGKENISILLPVFEGFLDIAQDSSAHDTIRQSVIILMGSLARHLDKEDPKVKPIVTKLVDALSTPSQQVQEAVANCLPPLVPAIKAEAPDLVKKLLNQLLESTVYGERKGAAYGLAGLVKGLGILYLKQLSIMTTLQEAIQNKKNHKHREGALFAFEMLCTMLGRLFEPYVVHVLPHLLLCFGDGNQYVREATDDTARAVMKNLSAHGVKLVLPSLLAALKEDSWRTKTGSVELLGAMAYCAPKQLSSCLPSIVPMLTKVLTDSHIKVQKAGAQALKQIGSVIRNPEIQAISSVLLEALMHPSTKTALCLQVLLQTSFVHFIDAPSLALIMPVLHRALSERSTETKKMAAQIIGNMYSLTDTKDFSPYLNSVVPGLKQSLLDPVPEVRGVSARALGALVNGMGEENFEDLLPWLMEMLTSENSSVDRSGAAQGLSEVLCGLGTSRLEKLMPEVIATTEKTELSPQVREGYLMLYIYLPTTFKESFIPFVGPILPSILKGLADEVEFVRDTSLRAGQRIVSAYADTAIELFLPELERGLFDDNWRIRFSSIQLLGDLLYKISGVTGKMTTEGEEDDNFGTSQSNQKIISSLGHERRNRVLAGLYMGRSDVSLIVRQAALHVWKVVVPNTPRILREILSTLFSLLLGCLASKSFDKRQIAARTLGDLVRKLGERVLPEIIPILEHGLKSDKSDERQGVCIGLSEIIGSTSREQVTQYVDSLVPTVRRALCDPLPEVRAAAAKTFDNLYSTIGNKALDDILPDLLSKMDDPSLSEYALDGLRQVMQIKSRVVLPFLVPKLIAPPVNSRALAILSAVADESLTKHLSKILPALLTAMQQTLGTDGHHEELEAARKLVLSVEDDAGVRTVIEELLEATKHMDPGIRKSAVLLLHTFCSETPADFSQFVPLLFRYSLHLMNDVDVDVVATSWDVLQAVTKSLDPSDQLSYIAPLRQAIKFASDDVNGHDLPGFCLPKKGITPVLPIFREGILNGTPELKEQAAYGLGEVITLTSAAALRPSVVNITGPLIRILGDRFSWNVKVAVLQTLGLLLGKVGAMLKPFLPQLQTTFIKALNDPNKTVRLKAASALQKLVILHTRVDPLFTELQNGVKNTEDNTIRETQLQALRGVIAGAGQKMGEPVRKTLTATLLTLLGHGENSIRVAAGGCIGSLAVIVPENELDDIINEHLTVNDPTVDWTLRHGNAIALSAVLHDAPDKVVACGLYDVITSTAVAHATTDRIPICSYGVRSLGFILTHSSKQSGPVAPKVLQTLAKDIQDGAVEVRSLAATAVKFAATSINDPLDDSTLKALVPPLVASAKDRNVAVKASAEVALAAVLQLSTGDDTMQACCRLLDGSMSDAITEMTKKTLRRLASQENIGIDEMTSPYTMEMG